MARFTRIATRLGTYWKSLLEDYSAAVKDIVKDSKSRPGKAALALSGLTPIGANMAFAFVHVCPLCFAAQHLCFQQM
ncbi:hypothetical protein V5799_012056 [Amblyomma americanum]|uniref:Uncharacterized protein n=1 Tax=Amblyomma americanum TaxID=6943 RepID=A0AAQ4EFI7_AMBAM